MKKITELHKYVKILLENNVDIALSDESIKEIERLDYFLQWIKSLGYE